MIKHAGTYNPWFIWYYCLFWIFDNVDEDHVRTVCWRFNICSNRILSSLCLETFLVTLNFMHWDLAVSVGRTIERSAVYLIQSFISIDRTHCPCQSVCSYLRSLQYCPWHSNKCKYVLLRSMQWFWSYGFIKYMMNMWLLNIGVAATCKWGIQTQ